MMILLADQKAIQESRKKGEELTFSVNEKEFRYHVDRIEKAAVSSLATANSTGGRS